MLGKVCHINLPKESLCFSPPSLEGASSRNATERYEAAAEEYREKVRPIIRECNRTNEKFTDPDFDIQTNPDKNCLNRLVQLLLMLFAEEKAFQPNNGVGGDNQFLTEEEESHRIHKWKVGRYLDA
jgi:hypothetical protein